MISSIFKHLIHVIGDKVCLKLLERAKTLQNWSFIIMTVSPTVGMQPGFYCLLFFQAIQTIEYRSNAQWGEINGRVECYFSISCIKLV